MKNNLLLIIVLLIISACNNVHEKTQITTIRSKNALFPEKLIVMDNVLLVDSLNRGWLKGFNVEKFLTAIKNNAKNGNLKLYNFSTDKNPLNEKEITEIYSTNEPIQILAFEEDWFFDAEKFQLYKTVNSYFTVNVNTINESSGKILNYKKLFTIKNDPTSINDGEMELLAKDICYEFSLADESPNCYWIENLNTEVFIKLLVDNILSGKIKTYSATNSKTTLSIDEIKTALKIGPDTIMAEDPNTGEFKTSIIENKELNYNLVKSVIFIEDWYYNPTTFSIEKKVKAIAPVINFEKDDGESIEQAKQILYVIYTGSDHPVLL